MSPVSSRIQPMRNLIGIVQPTSTVIIFYFAILLFFIILRSGWSIDLSLVVALSVMRVRSIQVKISISDWPQFSRNFLNPTSGTLSVSLFHLQTRNVTSFIRQIACLIWLRRRLSGVEFSVACLCRLGMLDFSSILLFSGSRPVSVLFSLSQNIFYFIAVFLDNGDKSCDILRDSGTLRPIAFWRRSNECSIRVFLHNFCYHRMSRFFFVHLYGRRRILTYRVC